RPAQRVGRQRGAAGTRGAPQRGARSRRPADVRPRRAAALAVSARSRLLLLPALLRVLSVLSGQLRVLLLGSVLVRRLPLLQAVWVRVLRPLRRPRLRGVRITAAEGEAARGRGLRRRLLRRHRRSVRRRVPESESRRRTAPHRDPPSGVRAADVRDPDAAAREDHLRGPAEPAALTRPGRRRRSGGPPPGLLISSASARDRAAGRRP